LKIGRLNIEYLEMKDQEKQSGKILQKELEECQKQAEEYLNGWKRAKADLINYKKEEGQRMEEFSKYNRQSFIFSVLPMLDNLDLAQKNLPDDLQNNEHIKGLLMIKKQLEDFLKTNGVEVIESMGQNFNPAFHEVIQAVECEGQESGTIIEETQKGYIIDGCLLRPSKVKVVK